MCFCFSKKSITVLGIYPNLRWLDLTVQSVYDSENRFQPALRAVSDRHFEIAWFDDEAVLLVPETQMLRREREFDAPLFARSQCDALESFQFLHRTRDAGGDITNVKLHHFVARAFADVLNFHADGDGAVRRMRCTLSCRFVRRNCV